MEKKLCKSNDRKISGVCGGIAEYFNIDATLVRVGFAIFCLFAGTGIIAYIIASFVMPDNDEF